MKRLPYALMVYKCSDQWMHISHNCFNCCQTKIHRRMTQNLLDYNLLRLVFIEKFHFDSTGTYERLQRQRRHHCHEKQNRQIYSTYRSRNIRIKSNFRFISFRLPVTLRIFMLCYFNWWCFFSGFIETTACRLHLFDRRRLRRRQKRRSVEFDTWHEWVRMCSTHSN